MVNVENEMVYWLMSRKQSRKFASDRWKYRSLTWSSNSDQRRRGLQNILQINVAIQPLEIEGSGEW